MTSYDGVRLAKISRRIYWKGTSLLRIRWRSGRYQGFIKMIEYAEMQQSVDGFVSRIFTACSYHVKAERHCRSSFTGVSMSLRPGARKC